MANRYFISGGVDNNWGTTGNWSLTSGGAGGEAVPTASDDVFFDGNSPDCTVNASARVAKSLDFTGYGTNTITMSQQITVSGSVTLISTMGIVGTGALLVNATSTLTSNGKTWPNALQFVGNITFTLADNWDIDGLVTCTASATINGNQINFGAGWSCTTGATTTSGTTNLVADGTGTITTTGTAQIRNNLTINTAGTITFAAQTFSYNTGTLTYTAGTVVTTGSTLAIGASTTLAVGGITWDALSFTATTTLTLNEDVVCSGLATLGSSNLTLTLNGNELRTSGGLRYGGTTGVVAGTTVIIITGTCTWDSTASASSGRISNTVEINAPGGTVTIGDASDVVNMQIDNLLLTAGTVVTDAGTWASGSGGGATAHTFC